MSSWHSYPKVWNLGHSAVSDLLLDEVVIEEKVDGSQFSFGLFDGQIKMKSKGKELVPGAIESLFSSAAVTVTELIPRLKEGWTYRAEYLQKPKHNVLAYDRIPTGHLIIFDINTGEETYLSYDEKNSEAQRLGLEVVPCLYRGKVDSIQQLTELLGHTSVLGGQKIEGFVVKNYKRFGVDGKALLGKFVSENFKEKHKVDWKEENPTQGDIVQRLINAYKTPARWDKALIHLLERGELEHSPRDIGKVMTEAKADTLLECQEEIKQMLFDWAWPQISRGLTGGLPEYYKEKLMARQFE